MVAGLDLTRTGPPAAAIVTGNEPAAVAAPPAALADPESPVLEVPQAAQSAVTAVTATTAGSRCERTRMRILRWVWRTKGARHDANGASERTALPPRTDRRRGPGVRARPPGGGITVAGQRRDHTGFAGLCAILGRPRTGVPYRSSAGPAAGRRGRSCDESEQVRR